MTIAPPIISFWVLIVFDIIIHLAMPFRSHSQSTGLRSLANSAIHANEVVCMSCRLCACPAYRLYKCGGARRPWYSIEVPSISEWFILLVNRISHPLWVGYGIEPNTFIVVDQQCLSKPVRDVLREVPYRYKATKLVLYFLTSARLVIVAAVSRLVR